MKTRQRIIFMALLPLLLAFAAIAFALRHQADTLSAQQHDTVEAAYRVLWREWCEGRGAWDEGRVAIGEGELG